MDENTKNLIDIIFDTLQLLILLTSALWAYFRFRKEDPLYPRIEFNINCDFFGPQQNSYLASLSVIAYNKGNVEHKFDKILLRIRGIKINEPVTEFKKYSSMVYFPEEIIKGVNIVPTKLGYYFVRPGINQTFNYTSQIPDNIRFIIIKATFKYQGTEEQHTAEKVFEVKVTKGE